MSVNQCLESFYAVRDRARKFVNDREWKKFHTPTNLALALSGETGEICEIFQWKGPLETVKDSFNEKDQIHIGEEVADVFIYSIRFADVCGIDLSHSVRLYMECKGDFDGFVSSFAKTNGGDDNRDLLFEEVNVSVANLIGSHRSPRFLALSIQSNSGKICELFANRPESQCTNALPEWTHLELAELAFALVKISLMLSALTVFLGTHIGQCVTDKFVKNEAKYPADLVKGSSAKYTEYYDQIKKKETNAEEIRAHSRRFMFGTMFACGCAAAAMVYIKSKP